MKVYIVVRSMLNPFKPDVPLDYRNKLLAMKQKSSSRDLSSTGNKIKKLKSLNFEHELSSDNRLSPVENRWDRDRHRTRIISEADHENPAINKLNQIFNTLFDKKVASKKSFNLKDKL